MTAMTAEMPNGFSSNHHQHHPHTNDPDQYPRPSGSASASLLSSSTRGMQPNGDGIGVEALPNLGDVDATCGGCKALIDQESGGVVVAFGSSLWHVDCFRCAKCQERVSADTNLLLLSDGSPVCGNCSYQCYVCKQAITEEAIMTGDESYHAHCFTCRTCKRRIEELVFAKTSQGIYCMACHNERVAKSRRHAEAKRQRAARKEREQQEKEEAERADKGKDEHGRAQPASQTSNNLAASSPANLPNPNGLSPLISPSATPLSVSSSQFNDVSSEHHQEVDRLRELNVNGLRPSHRSPSPAGSRDKVPFPSSPADSGRSNFDRPTLSPDRPTFSFHSGSGASGSSPNRNHNAGLGVGPVSLGAGLNVPMSKAEKRRSINPAMTFNMDAANGTFAVEPRFSPLPPSPMRSSFETQQSQPSSGGARSPTSPTSHAPPSQAPPQELPPRTTSLPEQMVAEDTDRDAPLPPPKPTSAQAEIPLHAPTPQINAPDLPHMSFSLSDPDFALILSNIDQSPEKLTAPRTADSSGTVRPQDLAESGSPSSPNVTIDGPQEQEPYSHFPQMRGIESPSPSRNRLSPHGGMGATPPLLLRTRQPSSESTTSLSKLGNSGAVDAIVGLVASAKNDGLECVPVDLSVLSGIIGEVEELREALIALKSKYTGVKRTSQQYSEGLTVAGEEYDKEVAHRRDLEAEVSRLRAEVHSQTARLSVISGDERRQENMRRRSNDLATSLDGLQKDLSRLRTLRDISLAEVEELRNNRNSEASVEDSASAFSQSLTTRLDNIKEQYREELEPLTAQREALQREIAELRETREQFLEESAALSAKNEDLAELNTQLSRHAEQLQETLSRSRGPSMFSKSRTHLSGSPSMSSLATSATLAEVPEETARVVKVTKPEPIEAAPARRFKWYKSSKGPDMANMSTASISKPLNLPPIRNNNQRPPQEVGPREHQFQQHSTMRFTRCELCQEKMWGLQEVRCASCGVVCHSKCIERLPRGCSGNRAGPQEIMEGPLPPSMFGRELGEQVVADNVSVPVIVTKCISAVEAVGMEYEGIYRKTGGSSQSKQITQLFERGDYDVFDLTDLENFNDISSTTSVLKTYFRQLPDPLLTHALHESFVAAASIRDGNNKHSALCALLQELPRDNYNTLKTLMLHLNRVAALASVNLMTSQNLGVVFGPTLMRSSDPGREFGDMAGKALSVQWMVDNAPQVFVDEVQA